MNMDARAGRERGEDEALQHLKRRKELESRKLPQVFIDGCCAGGVIDLQGLENDGVLGRVLRRQLCLKCQQPKHTGDMTCGACGATFEEVLPNDMLIQEELDKYTEFQMDDTDSGDEADARYSAYVDARRTAFGDGQSVATDGVAQQEVAQVPDTSVVAAHTELIISAAKAVGADGSLCSTCITDDSVDDHTMPRSIRRTQLRENGDDDGANGQVGTVKLDGYYTLAQLTEDSEWRKLGVPPAEREMFLADDVFEELFMMSKQDLDKVPKWKRDELKRKHCLF